MINTIYTTTKVQCVTGVIWQPLMRGPCLIRSSHRKWATSCCWCFYIRNWESGNTPPVSGIFQIWASSRTSYPGAIMTSLSLVQHAIRNPIYLICICILDINALILTNEQIYKFRLIPRTLISIQMTVFFENKQHCN